MDVMVEEARQAALDILVHNAEGPFHSLPRTAGWGYPEPYTRDLMIASLGVLVSGNQDLISRLRRVLETLALNQSPLGQIPSLVHEPHDLGASDTTPLFLVAVGIFRKASGEADFLEEAARKALVWMHFQSTDEDLMVTQQPTSDWRDEQWVLGYGLYVNTLVYMYLKLFHRERQASLLHELMEHPDIRMNRMNQRIHEGLRIPGKPHYALWAYKMYNNERFDLLGNSLAILSGLADPGRARDIVGWVETSCDALRQEHQLAPDLPPVLFPYIQPGDPDWYPRLDLFNRPGEYHNGGIWPFVCGFYIAALVAAGEQAAAERKLVALANLVRASRTPGIGLGFNEWYRAQDGSPQGQDWQTWSAAMYLYAAACVETQQTPFLDEIRLVQENVQEELKPLD